MGDDYVTCRRASDGEPVADLHLPEDTPASWLTHFVVGDRDSSVAIAEELDGEVLMSFGTPFGPAATIRGHEGAVFNVIAYTNEAEELAEHDPDAQGGLTSGLPTTAHGAQGTHHSDDVSPGEVGRRRSVR